MKTKDIARPSAGIGLTLDASHGIQSLLPWAEYVGRVFEIVQNHIILEVTSRIVLPISHEQLKSAGAFPKRGEQVGILVLDDGRIKLRKISDRNEDEETN
jgi:hypothetical protein